MFNIPNLFTAFNLICGILSIICSLSGRIDIAPFFIYFAALLDFFDGFIARKMKISGDLGKQLDSLADMVSFGVAPGILMMVVLIVSIYLDGTVYSDNLASHVHYQLNNWVNAVFYDVPNSMDASIKYLPFAALFIPFMSMFRLAKFNLDTRQTDSFIGVPTPLNTIFFTFFPLALLSEFDKWTVKLGIFEWVFNTYFLVGLIFIMSLLLVAEIPLFSLKFKNFKFKGNEIRFIFLVLSAIFIPVFMVWSIPLIVFLQLILSLIENQINKSKSDEVQS